MIIEKFELKIIKQLCEEQVWKNISKFQLDNHKNEINKTDLRDSSFPFWNNEVCIIHFDISY